MSIEPNVNRTAARPTLLSYLGFIIAPASENTQGSRGSKVFPASAPRNGSDGGAFPLDLFACSLLVLDLTKDCGGQRGPDPPSAHHLQKVVVEPSVSGGVDVGALNAGVEKAQGLLDIGR